MSFAVGSELISRVVGYKITKGNFQESSPNLPQRIAIIGEANTANQANLDLIGKQITSAKQAGDLYGYGSPIYQMARILLPLQSDGVGGIPVIVYPQATSTSTSKVLTITPTGVVNKNGTHTIFINGRNGIDGAFYDINLVIGDSTSEITAKIYDAVNNVLGSPVIATDDSYKATLTTKWKGLTAEETNVSVDTGKDSLGITYVVASTQSGTGTPSVQPALDQFGNDWITKVVNGYGTQASVVSSLESYNGIPDPDAPTGRFRGIVMKPFIALTGSVLEDDTTFTDSKKDEVTIALCPAPLSKGYHFEAAANMAVLNARVAQDTPHLDVAGKTYPDMPTPLSIGAMNDYLNRDAFVKKGSSTVSLSAGKYKVEDFVTTYHPIGETPPQFRYVRNLDIDFNVRYTYYLAEQINVVDHAIAKDADIVTVDNVVKPKQWKQVVTTNVIGDLTLRALIVDAPFSEVSLTVDLSTTNPDRLETFFRYKRSGFARISSTTAEAGFNFGTLN